MATMTVNLTQDDIKQAIIEYVEARFGTCPQGGDINLVVHRGYSDPRESVPDTISCTVPVQSPCPVSQLPDEELNR